MGGCAVNPYKHDSLFYRSPRRVDVSEMDGSDVEEEEEEPDPRTALIVELSSQVAQLSEVPLSITDCFLAKSTCVIHCRSSKSLES